MKKIISFFMATLLAAVTSLPAAMTPAINAEKADSWVLTWSDEFDGDKLNEDFWSYETGNWLCDEKGNCETSGWGNNEQEFYTDKNTVVSDGTLKIQAKKEAYTDAVQGEYEYTSSKLVTKNKFSMCYGKVDIRARVDSGKSLWPALWMLPEDTVYGKWASSGEIDIMEGYGSMPEKICGTIHFGSTWPENKYLTKEYFFKDGDSTENWHVYSVEWEKGEIRWYVDGVLYSTQSEWYSSGRTYPAPFDQNFYLILNLAVGGHFDGIDGIYADPSIFENGPKELEVDYVKVYQKNGQSYTPVAPSHTTLKPYFMNDGSGTLSNSDNGTEIKITNAGSETYSVMAVLENIKAEKNRKYSLDFDISSTVPREIEMTVENAAYDRYYDEKLALEKDAKHCHYELSFDENDLVDLKFQMGNLPGALDAGEHSVLISNLKLVEQTEQPQNICGDVDINGIVDITDMTMISLYCLGDATLSEQQLKNADVRVDGKINLADLATMKQYIMDSDITLPC